MNDTSLAVLEFAEAIMHGDAEHRRWLRAAAEAFVAEKPLPPAAGAGAHASLTNSLKQAETALMQAQDCIRRETPEDMTVAEADEDTIGKIREALRSIEAAL